MGCHATSGVWAHILLPEAAHLTLLHGRDGLAGQRNPGCPVASMLCHLVISTDAGMLSGTHTPALAQQFSSRRYNSVGLRTLTGSLPCTD